jgi:methylenetetrahydrofolate reductase (NADPH)
VLIAGYPEGHPKADAAVLMAALKEKIAYAQGHGHEVEIVTQFSFVADPVLDWLLRIRREGISAPVRIGLAGPAKSTTLIKFAVRCGIGNSIRALMRRPGTVAGLLTTTTPDDILEDLGARIGPEHGAVAGTHLFVFGGLKSTSEWLEAARSRAAKCAEAQCTGDRHS